MTPVIVFDLDDTLYLERDFQFSGFQAVADWLCEFHQIQGFFDVATTLFEQGQRGVIFNLALERLGVEYDSGMIQSLVNVFRNHVPDLTLCEDALWAIQYLRSKDVRSAIITDGFFQTQVNKIQALGLNDIFELIIFTDEYGRERWKPDPFSYRMIMDRLKCQAGECIYIGDNPLKDFVTAKRLGWRTVRIRRNRGEHYNVTVTPQLDADITISTLFELGEVHNVFSELPFLE